MSIRQYSSLASRLLVALMSIQLLVLPTASLARGGNNDTSNLNLSSTKARFEASQHGDFASAVITEGRAQRTITPADSLTAAEYLAVQQVLSSGQQSLLLNRRGAAVGGSFSVAGDTFQGSINKMVVPRGVSALFDAASLQSLNLSGNLRNAGNIYAFSTDSSIASAIISANNVVNQHGALISSMLPASSALHFASMAPQFDLTINALRNIINWGTISSSGNLTLAAGGSITNGLAGVIGNTATIQAIGNVNLITNNLVNTSTISSLVGNINIVNQTIANLTINNTYGQLAALQGAINISGKAQAFDLAFFGGDVIAKSLNANVGLGDIDINVQKLEGSVNLEALNAHVSAVSDVLTLGNLKIAGDPAFYNSAGNINLTGNLIFQGQPLALVASGNVTGNGFDIDTSSSTADGGDLFICAGCTVTPSGSALPSNSSLVPLVVGGPSSTGGTIS